MAVKMSYAKINNLYKDQRILAFKSCYALEKVHGTSASLKWQDGRVKFNSGGSDHNEFTALFNKLLLEAAFETLGHPAVTIHGEAYGGNLQGMVATYGDRLQFVAFDVKIGDLWLAVPQAADVATKLNLEFVSYRLIPTTQEAVDQERDAPSEIAVRRGCGGNKLREGVVLRPPFEVRLNNGERVCAKHKRDEFRETTSPRTVGEVPGLLEDANAIATEWVTQRRLEHVLKKIESHIDVRRTGDVCRAMVDDVILESVGEVTDSPEVRRALATAAARVFHAYLRKEP